MRKLLYLFVFVLALILGLYLTFPFERLASDYACKLGVSYSRLEVKRFPPELLFYDLKTDRLPVPVKELTLEPALPPGKVNYSAELCGGKVKGYFVYDESLKELTFKAKDLQVGECLKEKELPFKLTGRLFGSGKLKLNGGHLIGGEGELQFNSLGIEGIKFGLLTLPKLEFGSVKLRYRVLPNDRINLTVKGDGNFARLNAEGYLNYYPGNFENSFLNLKVALSFERGPLKGKTFHFTLRGRLRNLESF
jgi:type II secretion system protein N